jgi:hypothetical protein
VLDDWGLLVLMLMIWSGCLHATLLLIGWCRFLRGYVASFIYGCSASLPGLKEGVVVSAGGALVVCVAKAREFAGVETKAQ